MVLRQSSTFLAEERAVEFTFLSVQDVTKKHTGAMMLLSIFDANQPITFMLLFQVHVKPDTTSTIGIRLNSGGQHWEGCKMPTYLPDRGN